MREIKARAWDEQSKRMLDWNEIGHLEMEGKLSVHTLLSNQYAHFRPLLYTGLHDRNGKEICEGDIVKQTYHTQTGSVHDGTDMAFDGHHIGRVVITARGVCLKNPLHYSEDTDETNPMNAYKQVAGYRSEVIGNIYEHPHLLGEKGEGK